jgi:hypothetical protein
MPAIASAFRLPLFGSTVVGLVLMMAMADAQAACVETGISSFRKGGSNTGSYVGDPGDKCETFIGGADPMASMATTGTESLVGRFEPYADGWSYTFANPKKGNAESWTISIIHQSGLITTFKITATPR